MNNTMTGMGFTVINVFNQIISFLALGAAIAGLVVCILNRSLSRSMILCIVGFGAEIAVWVLHYLMGTLGGLDRLGPEGSLVLGFLGVFVNLVGPIATGILVLGLHRVFTELGGPGRGRRLNLGPSGSRRRRFDDED